jgi:hypothetical protein
MRHALPLEDEGRTIGKTLGVAAINIAKREAP